MNHNGLEDELRTALAPDGSVQSLDPARLMAGARRRRTRGVATAALVVVAVAGAATSGVLAGGRSLGGDTPDPANPGPTTLMSPSTPAPATPDTTAKTGRTPVPLTPGSCVAAVRNESGPGSSATRRSRISGEYGGTMLVADSRYWAVCDNTWVGEVAARRPERLQRPSPQDTDAFAVAGDHLVLPAGERDYYWAGGMVPAGVAAIRYTFPDSATVNAKVDGGFWLMRYLSTKAVSFPPATKIRVQLLSASGTTVNDFRLTWGEQTCAQISHGC